jgi:hypothetical protein
VHPEQGTFCDVQVVQTAAYRWRVSGSALTLTASDDTCADRDSILTGRWTKK